MTKYNNSDNLQKLESSDDIAYLLSRGKLCIPTANQFQELLNNTTIVSSNEYRKLTSNINGKTLILPRVYLWACQVFYPGNKNYAYALGTFGNSEHSYFEVSELERYLLEFIRPVKK